MVYADCLGLTKRFAASFEIELRLILAVKSVGNFAASPHQA